MQSPGAEESAPLRRPRAPALATVGPTLLTCTRPGGAAGRGAVRSVSPVQLRSCSVSGTKSSAPFSTSVFVGLCTCPPWLVRGGGHAGLRGSQGSGQRVCLSRSSLSSAKAHPSHWDLDASVPSPSHLCCVVCLRSGRCVRGPQGARPGLCSAGARLSEFRRLTAVFCFLLASSCQVSVSLTVFGTSVLVCSSAGGYSHGFK